MMVTVRRLDSSDKTAAVRLLSRAFSEDPAVVFFLGPSAPADAWDRFASLVWDLTAAATDPMIGVFSEQQMIGCALVEVLTRSRLRRAWAELMVILRSGHRLPPGTLGRLSRYRNRVQAHRKRGLGVYLTMVGVAPEVQGRGVGRQLLGSVRELVTEFGSLGLDTENHLNVDIYRRWGFTLDRTIRLDNLEIFLLSYTEVREDR